MARYSLNEVLKARAAQQGEKKVDEEIKLDDVTRVKVLSPTRKVMKRFKKNRLAMFGAYLLLTMFVVSFIGPLFYAWGQTDIFYVNKMQNTVYAQIKQIDAFNVIELTDEKVDQKAQVVMMKDSFINNNLNDAGTKTPKADDLLGMGNALLSRDALEKGNGTVYLYHRVTDRNRADTAQIYTLSRVDSVKPIAKAGEMEPYIGKVNILGGAKKQTVDVWFDGKTEVSESVQTELRNYCTKNVKNIQGKSGTIEVEGKTYKYTFESKTSGLLYGPPEEALEFDEGVEEDAALAAAIQDALDNNKTSFELAEKRYVLNNDGKNAYTDIYEIDGVTDLAAFSKQYVHLRKHNGALNADAIRSAFMKALVDGKDTIEVEYAPYHLTLINTGDKDENGKDIIKPYAIDEEGYTIQDFDGAFEGADGNYYYIVEKPDLDSEGNAIKDSEGNTKTHYAIEDDAGNEVVAEMRTFQFAESDSGYNFIDEDGEVFASMNDYRVVRPNGEDSLEFETKENLINTVKSMKDSGEKKLTIDSEIPEQDESGANVRDENGKIVYKPSPVEVTRQDTGEYNVRCDLVKHLIDRYAPPSGSHLLGTDGDGFDVLARIMYGGRISLLVGFVVVFLEIFLGIIMGGLAGYYGKWVDMLIMRLVDIFYCLPSMPILIIVGAAMDALRLNPYIRLLVMIAALGVMGWAGVARMVRGQILSLREQEFMVAAEATGIKVRSRIFRHLIPNVMPQLIVIATMGMGGVILTESTLSYLGLGVKHPLATWGSMINSVSTPQQMKYYPYIWIPVGILICLTVIAFNFVGDGLRDAYDPKSNK